MFLKFSKHEWYGRKRGEEKGKRKGREKEEGNEGIRKKRKLRIRRGNNMIKVLKRKMKEEGKEEEGCSWRGREDVAREI